MVRALVAAATAAMTGLVGIAALAGGSGGLGPRPGSSAPALPAIPGARLGDDVVAIAATQVGVPYVFGAASPGVGFDCSGLVWWAYREVGVELPRVTFDQAGVGQPVAVGDLAPGDLVFGRGGDPVRDLGHVSIYVGRGMVLTAPMTGQVVSYRRLDPATVQAARRISPSADRRRRSTSGQ